MLLLLLGLLLLMSLVLLELLMLLLLSLLRPSMRSVYVPLGAIHGSDCVLSSSSAEIGGSTGQGIASHRSLQVQYRRT